MANRYFEPRQGQPQHPKIRIWESYKRRASVNRISVEIRRDFDGLSFGPAVLYVFFVRQDNEIEVDDSVPWDLQLDEWLVGQHARAIDTANEKVRFSLFLMERTAYAKRRYGDGYFNSVFVMNVQNGPFAQHREVKHMLGHIRVYEANGETAEACREEIERVITAEAQAIMNLYDDDVDTAEEILGGAIAKYLDDRFHVSGRERLGLSMPRKK